MVDGYGGSRLFVPIKATGKAAEDTTGKPNVAFTNCFNFSESNKQTKYSPPVTEKKYIPTKYNDSGKKIADHTLSSLSWDTLYISGMTIRPTITTDKNMYIPDETVTWTVDGKVESGSENNHKVQFAVTIPKETQYIDETAKDYQGNPLPDPSSRVENADGTWTLKWVLDYMAEGSTYNPTVTMQQLTQETNAAEQQDSDTEQVRKNKMEESQMEVVEQGQMPEEQANEQEETTENLEQLVVEKEALNSALFDAHEEIAKLEEKTNALEQLEAEKERLASRLADAQVELSKLKEQKDAEESLELIQAKKQVEELIEKNEQLKKEVVQSQQERPL